MTCISADNYIDLCGTYCIDFFSFEIARLMESFIFMNYVMAFVFSRFFPHCMYVYGYDE